MKILIIDDEAAIRRMLKLSLEANGYKILEAETAQSGLAMAAQYKPDLILLDLGLPDATGFDVIKKIRDWSEVAIIVLTVQDADQDKVQALDGGADDYVTKPFSVEELLVRIRVALRHAQKQKSEDHVFTAGVFEMDLSAHLVRVDKQEIKLTATEYDILKILVKYAGKVVTHNLLLKEVWGPQSVEHTHYLRVYLGNIRKKLRINDSIPEFIVTEPGVGYRFKELT